MTVDEVGDACAITFRYGKVFVAEDNLPALYDTHLLHVYNERTVHAEEGALRERLFHTAHRRQAKQRFWLRLKINLHIVLQALNVENIGVVHAYYLIIALYE